MFNSYFASRFPEDLYVVDPRLQDDYTSRVIYGFSKMSQVSITIGMLARNIEEIAPYTVARINALREFFGSSTVVAFENDSTDRTVDILSPAVDFFITRRLEWPVNVSDKSHARKMRMAYYRNECRAEMLRHPSDYYMVYDSDILGGFSYEGIANSFSYEWDVVGSNSLIYDGDEEQIRRLYYDSWAYRPVDNIYDTNVEAKNLIFLNRGEKPIEVASCFGGLALYKHSSFSNHRYRYTDQDCDHVTLHLPMFFDKLKIIMNPSQITLYNRTRYVN